QLKPDSRFYKAINIGSPNAFDRAHGYEGKYLMIHGACVSVGCYAMTDSGIDEIFQFVTGALVFGQPNVQVSIYPFRMTDANMARHKYSVYTDFWKQLKPGYDYFEQTHKPPVVSIVNGRYVVSKPLSHEVVQPQLASNYAVPETK
ncbi:peptidoglycan meso-diaminopimelic acid protein amidase, partial [Enterobacter hormaechei subsp. steigerwaltii]